MYHLGISDLSSKCTPPALFCMGRTQDSPAAAVCSTLGFNDVHNARDSQMKGTVWQSDKLFYEATSCSWAPESCFSMTRKGLCRRCASRQSLWRSF